MTRWAVTHQVPLSILQSRILEWVAISSSRESSWLRDQTYVSYVSVIGGRFFTTSATWEASSWVQLSSVQSLSSVRLFATPWTAAHQASLSISNSRSSLRLASIKSVMPSSHLILCRPLLLLPPVPPSIKVFSNESTLRMRWPKYWSFSFSISPSNEHLGLISFRRDWLDLLAVQETLKSLLQHHSSKASILWRLAFFTVQLSHPYMTTGKTVALTRWIFVGEVMSLLFNCAWINNSNLMVENGLWLHYQEVSSPNLPSVDWKYSYNLKVENSFIWCECLRPLAWESQLPWENCSQEAREGVSYL